VAGARARAGELRRLQHPEYRGLGEAGVGGPGTPLLVPVLLPYRARRSRTDRDICRLLWKLWSPDWQFDEATFEASAKSFDNPDFVAVVTQSYRHRYGYAAGDPALLGIEARLQAQPTIGVPTINLHGDSDGVGPASRNDHSAKMFTALYERRMIPRVGHNLPQEAPADTVAAIRELLKGTTE
jgi:pimeloyl-ACP methyl ester carboxylesterase